MPVDVKVPELGESITEVQIADWLKQPGDWVEQDEAMVELDSDKATVELPAPTAGRLAKVLKQSGEFANVGDVVAVIDASASRDSGDGGEPTETAAQSGPVMPAAARLAAEHGIDAAKVPGSGPGGRVLKEDVQRFVDEQTHGDSAPAPAKPKEPAAATRSPEKPATAAAAPAKPRASVPPPPEPGERRERVVPMSPIRRRIAERLVGAQQSAALLTTFNEIDMSAVKALRKRHQDAFQARYGVKLGFMSFFTRATIEALQLFPALNAEIQGQEIVYRDYYDIGIAIGSGKGLVVPIIRDAETLSFAQIEERITDFAERAQNKKLDLSELEGGTFTISNGGVYGSLLSTPIVNPPQSGVLGLHAIQDRAMVVDGEIAIRPMMYVALTYDHRLVDGREAVTFLRHVKQVIEAPERMLLQV